MLCYELKKYSSLNHWIAGKEKLERSIICGAWRAWFVLLSNLLLCNRFGFKKAGQWLEGGGRFTRDYQEIFEGFWNNGTFFWGVFLTTKYTVRSRLDYFCVTRCFYFGFWVALPLLTCLLTPLSSLTNDAYFLALVGSFYCSSLSLSPSMIDDTFNTEKVTHNIDIKNNCFSLLVQLQQYSHERR